MHYGVLCSSICRRNCSRCNSCVTRVHILRYLTSLWRHDLSFVWSGMIDICMIVWNISTSSDQPYNSDKNYLRNGLETHNTRNKDMLSNCEWEANRFLTCFGIKQLLTQNKVSYTRQCDQRINQFIFLCTCTIYHLT